MKKLPSDLDIFCPLTMRNRACIQYFTQGLLPVAPSD